MRVALAQADQDRRRAALPAAAEAKLALLEEQLAQARAIARDLSDRYLEADADHGRAVRALRDAEACEEQNARAEVRHYGLHVPPSKVLGDARLRVERVARDLARLRAEREAAAARAQALGTLVERCKRYLDVTGEAVIP
jgi:hypothetical protein